MSFDPQLFQGPTVDIAAFTGAIQGLDKGPNGGRRVVALIDFLQTVNDENARQVVRWSILKYDVSPQVPADIKAHRQRLSAMRSIAVAYLARELSENEWRVAVADPLIYGVRPDGSRGVPFASLVLSISNQIDAVNTNMSDAWRQLWADIAANMYRVVTEPFELSTGAKIGLGVAFGLVGVGFTALTVQAIRRK